ncbi:site-specific integrase [Vibrio parahaemolyticus]|uniref:tyrosine-type recombinase/integrase n=1 Tax=Vibrio parahaemolyticus TaxID=670 RepID=UPI0027E57A25|nr:tyrosine-type recombinase/integrase [Vibrio parahaemolyticus]WMN98242.1 site-specific integrase [Vibrio parahaemolyticus]
MENRNQKTVKQYTINYMKGRRYTVAESTFTSEESKANAVQHFYGDTLIEDVCHSNILDFIDELHEHYANKTINGFLSILRGVFKRAELDGVIERNPMAGVKNLKTGKSKPNPFNKAELKKLHNTPAKCKSGKNAFEFDSVTGLRISEVLALGWDDVDLENRKLYVRRAKVLKSYKTPKTPESLRTVELNLLAVNILKEQFKFTGNKPAITVSVKQDDNKTYVDEEVRFVFYNSQTDAPFIHAAQFNKTFFRPFLEDAGVAHRGAGQLRHTFASQNLTAGIPKEWIAMQMGHADTAMIDKHYGEWIIDDSPDYANTSAKHLANTFGQSLPEDDVEFSKEQKIPREQLALIKALQNQPELFALVEKVVGNAL